jgi:hypothetical protein
MFDYNQRQIDDTARDNFERTFGHGKYAKGAEEVDHAEEAGKVCKESIEKDTAKEERAK